MYEAEDHQFFDELYQQWSKTTGAEKTYWMPEHKVDETGYNQLFGMHEYWDIVAFNQETKESKWVASVPTEADADFISGLHGAIPDLIRRLHEAIDEAVRKDEANDIAQGMLADALLESQGLRQQLLELEREHAELRADHDEAIERWRGQ